MQVDGTLRVNATTSCPGTGCDRYFVKANNGQHRALPGRPARNGLRRHSRAVGRHRIHGQRATDNSHSATPKSRTPAFGAHRCYNHGERWCTHPDLTLQLSIRVHPQHLGFQPHLRLRMRPASHRRRCHQRTRATIKRHQLPVHQLRRICRSRAIGGAYDFNFCTFANYTPGIPAAKTASLYLHQRPWSRWQGQGFAQHQFCALLHPVGFRIWARAPSTKSYYLEE